MINPILASLLGILFNFFSFAYFDWKLFVSSSLYILFVMIIYHFLCPFHLNYVFFISFNGFFAIFNLYMAKLWNFFELDDMYKHKWANIFMHFVSWFIRFFAGIISVVMIYMFSTINTHIIITSFKIIGVMTLVPAAVFIIEKLQNLVLNSLFASFSIKIEE